MLLFKSKFVNFLVEIGKMDVLLILVIVAVVGVVFLLIKGAFSQDEVNSEAEALEKEVKKQNRDISKIKKQMEFFLGAMHKPFLDTFRECDKVIADLLKNEIARLQGNKIDIISENLTVVFDKNDNLADKLKKIKVITDKRLNECKEIDDVINKLKINKMQDLYNKLLANSTAYDIDLMIETYKLISNFLNAQKQNLSEVK